MGGALRAGMCGIAGFVDFDHQLGHSDVVCMADALTHRGPDDAGYELYRREEADVGFGHRRLAILDLSSAGHQPMHRGSLSIVFNGEIYNFLEIREELRALGYSFSSDCDTEVILLAFQQWGPGAVQRFIGMYAFAIYDDRSGRVYLFRDRPGVKPLYYYVDASRLLFGSELKALAACSRFPREIDHGALQAYLQYGYVPAPYSIYQNTRRLKPGHYLTVDLKSRRVAEQPYWDVVDFYNKPNESMSDDEAADKLEDLLKSAFEYRLVADVPVGVFLSGGIDSTVVAALLQHQHTEPIKTFTIGFHEQDYNEAVFAKEIAAYLGTDHHELYCTTKEAVDILPQIPFYYDEPFSDSSAIPTILVSRMAKEKVKVALSADAGDETFAGYGKYPRALSYFRRFSWMPSMISQPLAAFMGSVPPEAIPFSERVRNFPNRYNKVREIIKAGDPVAVLKHKAHAFTDERLAQLMPGFVDSYRTAFDDYRRFESHVPELNKLLATDYQTYMVDDVLVKVDRATMSTSLEGRDPLLDHRIIEFAARLPAEQKLRDGESKFLLKKVLYRHVPRHLMERPKMGFSVPVAEWFKNELKEYLLHYIDETRLKREGIFDPKPLIAYRDRYLSGAHTTFRQLWTLLMFEMWYEQWIE